MITSSEFSSIHALFLLRFFNGSRHHRGIFRSVIGQEIHVEFDNIAGAGCTEKVISSGRTAAVPHLRRGESRD